MPEPEAFPARRIEVFTGSGRRRTWGADQKAAIVAESFAEGASVCEVARRHGLTPQQLYVASSGAQRDRGSRGRRRAAIVRSRSHARACARAAHQTRTTRCAPGSRFDADDRT
ncbi:transposase [Methylocystis sp. S23]